MSKSLLFYTIDERIDVLSLEKILLPCENLRL